MKLTHLGHSCFLLETSRHRLLFDPFLSGNPLATTRPEEVECDFILVTHGHEDHLGDAVAIAKRTGATIISNFETASVCGKQGAKAHPMQHGGAWQFPFGRVKLTIAHHSSSNETEEGFTYLGNPAGILVTTDGKTIYHAGDTALFLDMKLIGELDSIDVALLPIGDNFTMGPEDAGRAVDFLNAKLAIPMHYNTFDLIKVDPERFVAAAKGRGRVMEIGETIGI
ncbi:MAG TPA: metal-dependent hydrolase [Chthoniobacteraceae bacterium]|nr:metal-dependent hydrolase [Chthoniobacteraceae bacterium]